MATRIRWKIGSGPVYLGNSTDTAGAFPVYLIDSEKISQSQMVAAGNSGKESLQNAIITGLANQRTLGATGILNGYSRMYYGVINTKYTFYFITINATTIEEATMYMVYSTKSVTTAGDESTDVSFQFDNSLSATKNTPKEAGSSFSTAGWYILSSTPPPQTKQLYFNGTQIENAYFNGIKLEHLYFNGTQVF